MKERGGPHFVGQQIQYLSPQDYASGKQLTADQQMTNSKNIAPFSNNTNLPPPSLSNPNQGISGLNVVQYPPQSLQNAMQRKGKPMHGGAGTGAGGSEQRQLNLAEMVRSSNIMKQPSFQKKGDGSLTSQQIQQDYIKGTLMNKDFQLIAEPIVPKSSNNLISAFQQPALSHNNSLTQGTLKNGHATTSSHITYSNTAISTIQDKSDGSGLGILSQGGVSSQQYSQTNSRKQLDYANVNKNGSEIIQQSNQQQPLHHLLQQQNSQLYSTNRSVAAKAGQMQIFSSDKYSQLPANNSLVAQQQPSKQYASPAKSQNGGGSKYQLHHSSASQQIENIMDLQQMKIRSHNSQSNNNQKYTDYLNRFSTSQSIDQASTAGPNGSNLQIKYRDLRQQILDEDQSNLVVGNNKYLSSEAMGAQSDTTPLLDPVISPPGAPSFNTSSNNQQLQLQQSNIKKSPQNIIQKENRVMGLGISGEQMHLEEKTFLKKMALIANENQVVAAAAPNSQRQGGSSRKRQEMQINPRAFNARGYKVGEHQPLALQPKTRYDYVFIKMNDDQFERDFSDKVFFNRESLENQTQSASNHQSPSQLSFKNKRVSNMANTNPNEQPPAPQNQQTNAGHQLQLQVPKKNVRGSQDLSRENSFFSPVNKNGPNGTLDDGNLTAQTSSFGAQFKPPPTPKAPTNICSIISTNHTHIKVIANQGMFAADQMDSEQRSNLQTALNDCVQDVMTKVQEKGRIVKTTHKRKYVQNALNAPHLRVASIYVIVLDNSIQNSFDEANMRQTLMSDSSNTSSNNFNSTLTKLNAGGPQMIIGQKQVLKKDSMKDPIGLAKNMRIRNNSTMNSKGYESESEVKSTNSTTTSSTLQHFIPTRNFDQNGGSNTTKNSSRSLSQKGTQPRKNFQKVPAMGDDSSSLTPFLILKDPNAKKYPPTKIKILSPYDYVQHESHRINIALNNYNNFIQLCFKNKGKINVPAVIKLAKQIGVPVQQNMFNDGLIKSRELANIIKEKLIAYLCKVINESNTPENMPDNQLLQEAMVPLVQPVHQYKCYVGKGNNSILIRTLFKTRFWWLLHDKEEIEKVNFMWTQLRKNMIMDTFPCKFEDKKSGLRTQNNSNNPALATPGKIKSKKKIQNQNSSVSIESSGGPNSSNDKKDQVTAPGGGTITQPQITQAQQQLSVKLYNKLEDNFHLSNKKAMFLNIRLYYEAMGKDVFNAVPMTFHIKEGLEDAEFSRFKTFYIKEEEDVKKQKQAKAQVANGEASEEMTQLAAASTKRNIWIVKPGENTNRGQGITVLKDLDEIKALIQESTANKKRTCIVQKYIHNPLLINKRKFDIRLYAFLSSINGNIKGYFYADGYLRTSCREFTLQNLSNRMIHLTNDAVQKYADDYGKYEAGNKLSYTDFQNYLDKNYPDLNVCFERDLLPQMKKLVTDTFRAVYGKIDPKRRVNTFEIYGYDFMFDDDFKVYLIEVNTNPCLELGCPLLARLIPTMVENALRLSIDPLFPAPENWSQKKCVVNDICPENKFELIFDDKVDGPYLTDLMKEKNNIIIEIDEEELSDNEVNDEKDECEMVA